MKLELSFPFYITDEEMDVPEGLRDMPSCNRQNQAWAPAPSGPKAHTLKYDPLKVTVLAIRTLHIPHLVSTVVKPCVGEWD